MVWLCVAVQAMKAPSGSFFQGDVFEDFTCHA